MQRRRYYGDVDSSKGAEGVEVTVVAVRAATAVTMWKALGLQHKCWRILVAMPSC